MSTEAPRGLDPEAAARRLREDGPNELATSQRRALTSIAWEVAREAAALVLLDDDFSATVHAIRLGRRIYANLRQAMVYTMALQVPVVGLS